MSYIPGDSNVDVTLETLEVEEGGSRAVTERHLSIRWGGGGKTGFCSDKPPISKAPKKGHVLHRF